MENIASLERVNAVMHVHQWKNIGAAANHNAAPLRDMLVGCRTSTIKQTPLISYLANKTPDSSFDQFGVNANPDKRCTKKQRVDGAILQFSTDNFIRAGGNDGQNPIRPGGTHASALLSSFRYSSLTTRLCNTPLTWIGAAGAPNIVLSGRFKYPISPTIETHHRVSHTSKFPGYAVHTGGAKDNALKATPEVFEGGKFIMPGIKTPEHAVETLSELVDIVTPFLIKNKEQ